MAKAAAKRTLTIKNRFLQASCSTGKFNYLTYWTLAHPHPQSDKHPCLFQNVSYDNAPMVTIAPEQHLRILHLEDSLADQKLVQRAIVRLHPSAVIETIDSLESFDRLIANEAFDIILADYWLNGFTAIDAWQHVAQLHHPPPFVLVSGAVGEAAAVDAMHLGIADYLLKDDLHQLSHVISRAIDVHKAKRERELAEADLAESQQRLAELTEHLQRSIEQERAAIAREIHDDIGGALAAVRFDIAWISRNATTEAMREHATAATDMLQHAVESSQRIMMNLRPPVLEQGLVAAVRWLASGFEKRTEIQTQLHLSREDICVTPEIQLVAYRTAQESLTNIAKHAQASRVTIDISDQENVLTLEIADNGCGMAPDLQCKPKAFGLKGLQERARIVGGWLDISSQPTKGTCITLTVPLT